MLLKKEYIRVESADALKFDVRETVTAVFDSPSIMLPLTTGKAEIPPSLSMS